MFKPNTYAKKRYFRTTAAVKQTTTTSINVFNKCNSHYNDKFLDVSCHDTIKLLPKRVPKSELPILMNIHYCVYVDFLQIGM